MITGFFFLFMDEAHVIPIEYRYTFYASDQSVDEFRFSYFRISVKISTQLSSMPGDDSKGGLKLVRVPL